MCDCGGNLSKQIQRFLVPMPVILVSSQGFSGIPNIAPYGSTMAASLDAQRPCIAVGIVDRQRTYRNVLESAEFVANIPTIDMIDIINKTSLPCPPNVNKFERFNIATTASLKVRPPSVKACKVRFECKLLRDIEFGGDRNLILGEVIAITTDDTPQSPEKQSMDEMKSILARPKGYYSIGPLLSPRV